ncbi:DapH/DapD/GlmU-related protein [Myceligenerans xiligouense]|uniref:Succinyltransferase-like protein n=1 Tax=Myceligenerans xiligouense TaxID=253184 RepID=A0A3N4ZJJ3_9MICO|nr:DapH/DapD/GlmU-related protein [Myceligenerans xiligouense]RPF21085.1 succinyltransferase-like protein [Myceligenerans xiligouense]
MATPQWADAIERGLVQIAPGAVVHPTAVLILADRTGQERPLVISAGTRIGAFAVMHGGTVLGEDVEIGHGAVVGEPETGYALRAHHDGHGADTVLGDGVVLRVGAIVYAGVRIGARTTVGHHTLLRTGVRIGADSQLGHLMTVERETRIGDRVRCSPLTHLTAQMHIGDDAFIGARVGTINDKHLIWRDPDHEEPLRPPRVEAGAKVGTGVVLLAGVVVGAGALVGAGSVVTRDVAPGTTVFGNPARENGGRS